MIKNILFFLLLLFGIQISILNIQFGIIYNFCLILIFNKYLFLFYTERFTNCLYNTPSYQISLNPLIIDLGTINKCSQKQENTQEIFIDSTTTEINFILEIPELITMFKIGDSINISGTSIPSNKSYTIKFISAIKIELNEKILKTETIKEGKIIIKFAFNLNPNKNFIIYKYDDLNNNISNVDNSISYNKTNLIKIKTNQDLIKKTNNIIYINNEKIKDYESIIKNNNNMNDTYKIDIQDKFILTNKYKEIIDEKVNISNNQLLGVQEEAYDNLNQKLEDINSIVSTNEKYKLDILSLKKENEKLNSLKCSYIKKIKKLITEINSNYGEINVNNIDIDKQNINYNLFNNKCNKTYNMENSLVSDSTSECLLGS
jgi:hypothetical protein